MLTARDLLVMSSRELMTVLCDGYPIDPDELDDLEYKGISLGLPQLVEKLSWKTFKKVFHRDPRDGRLRGWNVRIEQTGIEGEWIPKTTNRGEPVAWGHYRVVPAVGRKMPAPCDRGLLIDYGQGGNRPWDPISRLRDPVVAVNPGSAQLLLGWSYLDLGRYQVGTPSFFSLERDVPLTHRASAVRSRFRASPT